MLTAVQDAVLQLLPSKRRRSPSGWLSFNAVCCHHRGESPDTRGRGGLMTSPDGSISYHCFNCQFKVSYRPGWHLGFRFRRWLTWLGADENLVRRLVIEAVRVRDIVGEPEEKPDTVEIKFSPRALPDDVRLVDEDPVALAYCRSRAIDINRYPLLVSQRRDHNLNRRVIVPFTWRGELIGYSARTWEPNIKPKYHSQYEANYVYNMDQQKPDAKFVCVAEGPFDAMSIDGVAVLSNECSETQADIIDSLNREIILVPDRDRAGTRLIDNAIDYGWTVSFPIWHETCKDVNEAVVRYGRLFVLKSILDSRETSRLKIELKRKRLYG
jgi:hypothetical protein